MFFDSSGRVVFYPRCGAAPARPAAPFPTHSKSGGKARSAPLRAFPAKCRTHSGGTRFSRGSKGYPAATATSGRGSEARVTGGNGSARRGIRECGPLSRAGRGLYRLPETVSEDSTAIARSIAFGSVGSSRKKRAGYRIYRSRTRKVIGGDRGNPMERGGPLCICSTRP